MILTTHMAVAAMLTRRFAPAHPLIAFLVALASHYLLDAIPHWGYSFSSLPEEDEETKKWRFTEKSLTRDLVKAALDSAAGLGLIFYIIQSPSGKEIAILLAVALGSVLPDILQSLYYTQRFKFLKPHQEFHKRFHTKIKLDHYPLLGIPLQTILILLVVLIF